MEDMEIMLWVIFSPLFLALYWAVMQDKRRRK
jgi:hypothetical protein